MATVEGDGLEEGFVADGAFEGGRGEVVEFGEFLDEVGFGVGAEALGDLVGVGEVGIGGGSFSWARAIAVAVGILDAQFLEKREGDELLHVTFHAGELVRFAEAGY